MLKPLDRAQRTDLVLTERRGAVLVVSFHRPERLNAWTDDLEDAYFDVLEAAQSDSATRAIVVTGAGRGFCAGADMEVLAAAPTAPPQERPRPRHFPMLLTTPIVAAVNGPAAGLGLVEALFCDVRFASPQAVFLTSFVRRGLVAEYGCAWLLQRLVGYGRAIDLLLSGRAVDAEEAHRIGLVDHLAPADGLLDAAVAYADELATWCSPSSMATIKGQLARDAGRSFSEAVVEADVLMRESFLGPDLGEGVASFVERRRPRFTPLPHLEI